MNFDLGIEAVYQENDGDWTICLGPNPGRNYPLRLEYARSGRWLWTFTTQFQLAVEATARGLVKAYAKEVK